MAYCIIMLTEVYIQIYLAYVFVGGGGLNWEGRSLTGDATPIVLYETLLATHGSGY